VILTIFVHSVLALAGCGGESTGGAPAGTTETADLAISLVAADTATFASSVTIQVRVRNLGPDAARRVVVSDTVANGRIEAVGDGGQFAEDVATWPEITLLGGARPCSR
jgi:uncharacterized repeat protein (TIGR01451 family)